MLITSWHDTGITQHLTEGNDMEHEGVTVNGESLTPVYGYRWRDYLITTDSARAAHFGIGAFTVARITWAMYPDAEIVYIGQWLSRADALTGAMADYAARIEAHADAARTAV